MSNDLLKHFIYGDQTAPVEKPVRDPNAVRATELHPYAQSAVHGELERLRALPDPWHEGAMWDITTFEVACNLIEIANSPWAGYSIDEAYLDLTENAPRDHTWGEREIEQKWRSAVARVRDACRPEPAGSMRAPEVGTFRRVTVEEETGFWDSEPYLKHIRDCAYARTVSPWAVLGFTLARCAVATPYFIMLPGIVGSKASLNTFIGLVGPSGSGKNAAMAVAEECFEFGRAIHPRRLASGEAMAHLFKRREAGNPEPVWVDEVHAELIVEDEIDRLTGLSGRQGSTIMADLRSAWSGGPLGQVAADKSRSLPVEANMYRLALVAGIQPGRAGALLEDSAGGTPQRFLWMPSTDPNIPEYDEEEEDHIPVLPRKHWSWENMDHDLARRQQYCLTVAKPIRTIIKTTQRNAVRGVRREDDQKGLDGHALLTRLKVAAVLALLGGRFAVREHEWDLAGVIMDKSDETRAMVQQTLLDEKVRASRAVAEAKALEAVTIDQRRHDAALESAKERIRKVLTTPRTPRELARSLSKAQREVRDEAIQKLLEDQAITLTDGVYAIKTA